MQNGLVLDIFAPFNKKFSAIRYPAPAIDKNLKDFKELADKIYVYVFPTSR